MVSRVAPSALRGARDDLLRLGAAVALGVAIEVALRRGGRFREPAGPLQRQDREERRVLGAAVLRVGRGERLEPVGGGTVVASLDHADAVDEIFGGSLCLRLRGCFARRRRALARLHRRRGRWWWCGNSRGG